jgi:hypothetical protein
MVALLDRFWGLCDRFLGVSKATFFGTQVVPANPNDAYYDDRCCFCWDKYGDTHEGVRVLPCNHVFGEHCLQEIINSPNGNVCPICRCLWYRPPWTLTTVATLLLDSLDWIVEQPLNLVQQLYGFYDSLTPYVKTPVELVYKLAKSVYDSDSPYYWADLIISRCTNMYARNPDLDLQATEDYMRLSLMLQHRLTTLPFAYAFKIRWAEVIAFVCTAYSVLFGFGLYLFNPIGGLRCNNKKDACILALILLASTVIAHYRHYWLLLYSAKFALDLDGGLRRCLMGILSPN